MPIRTGSDRIREALAEQAARAAAGRKWLMLREDGESALVRFLSDIDDGRAPGGLAVQAKFHVERSQGAGGQVRMSDPIMCAEDETCNLCTASGEPSRSMLLAWVWVYHIDHAQNQEQKGRFAGEPWQPVTAGDGRTLYRETIEAPRVVKATSRLTHQIMAVYGHEGALTTKDYTLTRVGARGSTETTYSLYPQDKAKFEREIPALVSLADFAEGRATLGGEEVQTHATAKSVEPGDVVPVTDPAPDAKPVDFGSDATEEPEATSDAAETEEDDGDFALGGEDE